MVIIVICLLMEKKSVSLKQIIKMQIFQLNFVLEEYPINLLESRKVYLKLNGYDFSVDYDAIDKSDILNIDKYLIVKNNTK